MNDNEKEYWSIFNKMNDHTREIIDEFIRPLLDKGAFPCHLRIFDTTALDTCTFPQPDSEAMCIVERLYINEDDNVCASVVFDQGTEDESRDEWVLLDYFYPCIAQIAIGLHKIEFIS